MVTHQLQVRCRPGKVRWSNNSNTGLMYNITLCGPVPDAVDEWLGEGSRGRIESRDRAKQDESWCKVDRRADDGDLWSVGPTEWLLSVAIRLTTRSYCQSEHRRQSLSVSLLLSLHYSTSNCRTSRLGFFGLGKWYLRVSQWEITSPWSRKS